MTFEEFENTLQDWLDEGRLDEVETLIPLVREADRVQCQELLDTYQALFVGLTASASLTRSDAAWIAPADSDRAEEEHVRTSRLASSALLALAACLAMIALVPGWIPSGGIPRGSDVTDTASGMVSNPGISETSATNIPGTANANQSLATDNERFSLFATTSIEPLARGMANQTDTAFRSLNQVSRDFNPIDQPMAAYRDAAPLIETLTHGFLPGTRSLSSAFSVLQESAADPVPHASNSQQEPSANVSPENTTVT